MRFNRIISGLGMSMFLLASCVQEELPHETEQKISFEAGIEAPDVKVERPIGPVDTRTYIDENDAYESGVGTLWRAKETIGVYSNYSKNVKFTSTNSSNAGTVSFSGLLFGTPKYAYYPYSNENSGSPATAVKGIMPSVQSFDLTYKDIVGDYRAGTFDSKTWFSSKFTFKRLVSLLKFAVDASGTPLEGSKIKTIEFKVSNNSKISGNFTINLENQTVNAGSFAEGNNCITLKWSNEPSLMSGRTYTAYATCLPSVKSGDDMTFVITTDTHRATITKTSKIAFEANQLYHFPLTLSAFSDMVIEELTVSDSENEILGNLTGETPILNSFKFTVAANPGKILPRKFTHNSSFAVTISTVAEEKCIIDQDNKKVTLYVPYLNNRKLVPTFEIPEGTALVYEGGIVENGVTEIDFTQYKQVAVINGEGEGVIYDVELTNTGLPVVVVNQLSGTVTSETNDKYEAASNAWYKATGTGWQPKDADWSMEEGDSFMVYNADGTSALTDKNGAVVADPVLSSTRLRGNVTQQMPKKPFAIKLDKKHGVLDMPAHKRWVLLANWKDRTLMRNEVAFGIADVFKRTFPNDGMAWNPSGQHVELVYNGVYVGNYYLCEHVKIDGNRLDINDPYDPDDGYSGNPADYGYLLEADDGYDENWKFTTACYVPFLFKDDGNQAMVDYAAGLVRGIEDELYAGNYDTAFNQMDLTSFVDYWLVQELMMNSETKHPKSCYNYLNDGIMYAGPLWDFDWNTLPVSSTYSEEGYSYTSSLLSKNKAYHKRSGYPDAPLTGGGLFSQEDKNYLWYPMLVKSAEFKALAAERWNTVKGAIQAYVDTEIPMVKAAIAKSEAENAKMWPIDSGTTAWGSKRYSVYGIGGGFCGDEAKSFSDAVSTMQSTLNTRINGMNFVSNQSWPSVTYGTK